MQFLRLSYCEISKVLIHEFYEVWQRVPIHRQHCINYILNFSGPSYSSSLLKLCMNFCAASKYRSSFRRIPRKIVYNGLCNFLISSFVPKCVRRKFMVQVPHIKQLFWPHTKNSLSQMFQNFEIKFLVDSFSSRTNSRCIITLQSKKKIKMFWFFYFHIRTLLEQ
jgi:hypothetical protein